MAGSRSHIRSQMTWLAMMDLACLFMASFVGVYLRFSPEEVTDYVFRHLEGWLMLFGGILVANYLAGSYRLQHTYSRFNLVITCLFSLVFSLLILSVTSYAWLKFVLGRGVLIRTLVWYTLLSLSLKLLVYRVLFRSDIFLCRTVVLGCGDRARNLRQVVEHELVLPSHKVVAFVPPATAGSAPPADDNLLDGVTVIPCRSENLETLVRSLSVSLIVVGMDELEAVRPLYPTLKRLRMDGIEVLSPLNVYEIYRGLSPLNLVDEEILMQASLESSLPMVWRVKRLMDIAVSIVGGAVCAPLATITALVIKLSDPSAPVLYKQNRVGQFGRIFTIYKFRTMRVGAEIETGPVWATEDDPRITGLGRFLRRYRLDEIPQFYNILKGEMSLVGPRPERPEIIRDLDAVIPFYRERENAPPGLTGWAQIRYPYGSSVEDARKKLEYDLYYLKHMSLSLDMQILLSTLRIMVLGKERKST